MTRNFENPEPSIPPGGRVARERPRPFISKETQMKRSLFVIVMFAIFAAALLTGCTGQRSTSDQSGSSPSMRAGPYGDSAGRGVEDPRG